MTQFTKFSPIEKAKHTIVFLLVHLTRVYGRWQHKQAQKESLQQLARLPPYLLKDIGITSGDVYRELHAPRADESPFVTSDETLNTQEDVQHDHLCCSIRD